MGNIKYFRTIYNQYCKEIPKNLQIPKGQCKNILKKLSAKVIIRVFDAEEVKIPIIGTIRVKKIKQKYSKNKLKVDWATTKKEGKKVYHLNEHRSGYFYRIMWRRNNNIKGINLYSFIAERHHFKRPLGKILKIDFTKDFFED